MKSTLNNYFIVGSYIVFISISYDPSKHHYLYEA